MFSPPGRPGTQSRDMAKSKLSYLGQWASQADALDVTLAMMTGTTPRIGDPEVLPGAEAEVLQAVQDNDPSADRLCGDAETSIEKMSSPPRRSKRATGVAERVVAVEKAGIEQADAIRQSLFFGFVFVSPAVRSFDMGRILIPRGSRLCRGYESDVSPGQGCVLIAWDRLVTTDACLTRIGRASVTDVMASDRARTARLKGPSPRRVIWGHVMRNAMIAPVTVILLQVNRGLAGIVVVWAISACPGIGSLLLRAALFGDIFTGQALTMLALTIALATQLAGGPACMALDQIRI